ncbi:hypothetical protein Trydic_g5293 [Trypoxylus dichotomus]
MDAQETNDAPEPNAEAIVAGPSLPPPTRKHSEKPKSSKVAPIFLKDKDKWTTANRLITSAKINTTKCKLVSNGIQIDPATEDDYRKLNKLLEKEDIK